MYCIYCTAINRSRYFLQFSFPLFSLCTIYSRRRIYQYNEEYFQFQFLICTKFSNSKNTQIRRNTKRTCQLSAFLSLLVNMQLENILSEIKIKTEKSSSLCWYRRGLLYNIKIQCDTINMGCNHVFLKPRSEGPDSGGRTFLIGIVFSFSD